MTPFANLSRTARETSQELGSYRSEGPGYVGRANLPNDAWMRFITGPLSADDWALIGRVERNEITVAQAVAGRGL